jgi:hypothetical protein
MDREELAERLKYLERFVGKLAWREGCGFEYYQGLMRIDYKYGHIESLDLCHNWSHEVTLLEE